MLVCEYQQQCVFHFAVANDSAQFCSCLLDTVTVVAVDDKDKALGSAVVVAPKRPNLVLSTDIPNIELRVLIRDGLDVEADGRDGSDVGIKLELVQDGCIEKSGQCRTRAWVWSGMIGVLVLPAASRPSIRRRISLDPKILAIILEIEPPMAAPVSCECGGME